MDKSMMPERLQAILDQAAKKAKPYADDMVDEYEDEAEKYKEELSQFELDPETVTPEEIDKAILDATGSNEFTLAAVLPDKAKKEIEDTLRYDKTLTDEEKFFVKTIVCPRDSYAPDTTLDELAAHYKMSKPGIKKMIDRTLAKFKSALTSNGELSPYEAAAAVRAAGGMEALLGDAMRELNKKKNESKCCEHKSAGHHFKHNLNESTGKTVWATVVSVKGDIVGPVLFNKEPQTDGLKYILKDIIVDTNDVGEDMIDVDDIEFDDPREVEIQDVDQLTKK